MSNDAVRTSQLGIVTTLANTDRVVVLTNPATAAQTQTVAVSTLGTVLAANALPHANATNFGVIKVGNNLFIDTNGILSVKFQGPYANDSSASINGISLGGIYYDTTGVVRIRLV